MLILTGSYSFPIIKKLNLILRNLFLSLGFNVSTVIEIKCFFDSRDFTKFGLDTFMYVSFEIFLYINSLYKCCSSMLIIKPVEYVNSTVQGHTSTYTTLCFVLGSFKSFAYEGNSVMCGLLGETSGFRELASHCKTSATNYMCDILICIKY
jgi:hypothetical protein